MPIPALNIIAIHARLVNSGSESSAPSLIRPYRLIARTTHSTRKTSAATTKSHAKLFRTHASAVEEALSNELLPSAAQPTTATTASTPMVIKDWSGEGPGAPGEPPGGAPEPE